MTDISYKEDNSHTSWTSSRLQMFCFSTSRLGAVKIVWSWGVANGSMIIIFVLQKGCTDAVLLLAWLTIMFRCRWKNILRKTSGLSNSNITSDVHSVKASLMKLVSGYFCNKKLHHSCFTIIILFSRTNLMGGTYVTFEGGCMSIWRKLRKKLEQRQNKMEQKFQLI